MKLETNRLVLLPASEEYLHDIFHHFTEEVTVLMTPSPAKNIQETKAVIEMFVKQREAETDFVFMITKKESGAFIGAVGLHEIKEPIPHLGIWTKKSAHGNHYGREAIGGMIDFAKSLGFHKVHYSVDYRNEASKKIPLFYGGKLVQTCKESVAMSGKILQLETYEIPID